MLTFLLLRATVTGVENFPKRGPALIVFNHLGDADAVLMLATLPFPVAAEGLGKIELSDHWLVGPVFRAYGIIWVHQGRPDRRALRAALDALSQGRMVTIAPEARQSVIGGLEDGTEGAAFLALRSGVPIVPVSMTGTENQNVYGHLKRWRRAPITLNVGKPFLLPVHAERQKTLQEGTRLIMETLANLLPESYRGKYRSMGASETSS
ncbi:MAG TPA: lysophospholipid acyltransferase family protein [Anaerolineales bacterium]|nr:lysophospholipid acyltransferase family protein [Anaerolineales bacterium]